VDVTYSLNGVIFRWDELKRDRTLQSMASPSSRLRRYSSIPTSGTRMPAAEDEARDGALGFDFQYRLLFVVHLLFEDDGIRIISARHATASERKR